MASRRKSSGSAHEAKRPRRYKHKSNTYECVVQNKQVTQWNNQEVNLTWDSWKGGVEWQVTLFSNDRTSFRHMRKSTRGLIMILSRWLMYNPVHALIAEDRDQFQKYSDSVAFGEKYDFGSIMHYAWNDFAIDDKVWTIRAKAKFGNVEIGQRRAMSAVDIRKINSMYKCDQKQPETTPPPDLSQGTSNLCEFDCVFQLKMSFARLDMAWIGSCLVLSLFFLIIQSLTLSCRTGVATSIIWHPHVTDWDACQRTTSIPICARTLPSREDDYEMVCWCWTRRWIEVRYLKSSNHTLVVYLFISN